MKILFTTEERDQIQMKDRKLVPRVAGNPTTNQTLIDEAFPLVIPNWDFNLAEGKERHQVYRQTLMAGGVSGLPKAPNQFGQD